MFIVWILLGMGLGSWLTQSLQKKELDRLRGMVGHLRVQAKYGNKPVSHIATVKTSIDDLGRARNDRELLAFLGYKGDE